MDSKIRKPVCAGTWYTGTALKLERELEAFLMLPEKTVSNPKAIIVPHAGYMFSGKTASHSFKQIEPDINKVIILGTPHHHFLQGASICNYEFFRTPLGDIKVNPQTKELLKEKNIFDIPEADLQEHSIEIELPFLQRVLKDFSIIPIIVGQTDYKEFAYVLEKLIDDKTLIVVSVDLSHFHKYGSAKILDKYSIDAILNLEIEKIEEAEIDSPFAVMSLMDIAKRKGWKPELLDYKNSGDITGDKDKVVGYAAIAFC